MPGGRLALAAGVRDEARVVLGAERPERVLTSGHARRPVIECRLLEDVFEARPRLLWRRAWLEPAHQTQPPRASARHQRAPTADLRLPRDRYGNVRRAADLHCPVKALRRDADDRESDAVKVDLPAHYPGVAPRAHLPVGA